MTPSVRTLVADALAAMRADDLQPADARRLEVQLAALLGNIAAELRAAEVAYKRILLGCYGEEKTANRAKLVAEARPEYARWREAKDTERLVQEALRSLRSFQRSLNEELRLQR